MNEQDVQDALSDSSQSIEKRYDLASELIDKPEGHHPSAVAKAACWVGYRALDGQPFEAESMVMKALARISLSDQPPIVVHRWTCSLSLLRGYLMIQKGGNPRGILTHNANAEWIYTEPALTVNMVRSMALASILSFNAGNVGEATREAEKGVWLFKTGVPHMTMLKCRPCRPEETVNAAAAAAICTAIHSRLTTDESWHMTTESILALDQTKHFGKALRTLCAHDSWLTRR